MGNFKKGIIQTWDRMASPVAHCTYTIPPSRACYLLKENPFCFSSSPTGPHLGRRNLISFGDIISSCMVLFLFPPSIPLISWHQDSHLILLSTSWHSVNTFPHLAAVHYNFAWVWLSSTVRFLMPLSRRLSPLLSGSSGSVVSRLSFRRCIITLLHF